MNLDDQTFEILAKSKMVDAGIGKRPIIFFAHSIGGLLLKNLLVIFDLNRDYQAISRNTIGIIFYGTPHKGNLF